MQKNIWFSGLLLFLLVLWLAGCGNREVKQIAMGDQNNDRSVFRGNLKMDNLKSVQLTDEIKELENGFSAVRYEGDYGFDAFLAAGGASSNREVAGFLTENVLSGINIGFSQKCFGCSTVSVTSQEGDFLFGRNFDWNSCDAMVVASYPESGYAFTIEKEEENV